MAACILVVDDEPSVTDLLAYNLRKCQYEVIVAADGAQALQLARQQTPDLILLDIMLPKLDGLDVCRELRKTSRVPIILITARGEEIDRVLGLELGADDYICKPFSVRELLARVKAVLRRSQPPDDQAEAAEILQGPAGIRLDVQRRQVEVAGRLLEVTRLEFDLLQQLLASHGRVLTRQQLLEQTWGYPVAGNTRAVDSALKRLRARLRQVNPQVDVIETVRGVGYRLKT